MPEPTSVPADQSGQPANQAQAQPNAFAQAVKGDWNLAEQRFHDLTQHTRAIQQQNQLFQNQLDQLEAQRQSVYQPAQGTSRLTELANGMNVDPNLLAAAIAEAAAPMVQKTFEPIGRAISARQELATALPGYIENEQAVFSWASTRPDLLQMANRMNNQGFPREASQLLYREWQAANPPTNAQAVTVPTGAQLPALGGGGSPAVQGQQQDQSAEAKLFAQKLQHAIATKNTDHIATELFKDVQWIGPPGYAQG